VDKGVSVDLEDRVSDLEVRFETEMRDLFSEVRRRDKWLIGSIWGVVQSLNWMMAYGVAIGGFYVLGWTAWWQMAGAGLLSTIAAFALGINSAKMQEDDEIKIDRDAHYWRD
jgi:hypothetical protein